jgi:hypothetical protein
MGATDRKSRDERVATTPEDLVQRGNLEAIEENCLNNLPSLSFQYDIHCITHVNETIKYYCRSDTCKKALCSECVIDHAKHDFINANELASFEVKSVLQNLK